MDKILLAITALLFFSFSAFSQDHRLTIEFGGLKSNDGQLMLRIQDSEGNLVKKEVVKVKSDNPKYSLLLPSGEYAIAVFHDQNSNEKLDKNLLGIPNEIYGFSNNARGTFGPPALKEQLFQLNSDRQISIDLK